MTSRPTRLVQTPITTSPITYSEIIIGVAKTLRKLRDQTSSKKAWVTPCMTRVRNPHSSTAPSSAGTKLNPPVAKVFRYRVMKPQRTMSTATQENIGSTRVGDPRSR